MSDIIRSCKLQMPRAKSDDVPVPNFVDTYRAVRREAEQVARENQRGMARIRRAITQSTFPQAAPPLRVPTQSVVQPVWILNR